MSVRWLKIAVKTDGLTHPFALSNFQNCEQNVSKFLVLWWLNAFVRLNGLVLVPLRLGNGAHEVALCSDRVISSAH
jgi:hypothetical protein